VCAVVVVIMVVFVIVVVTVIITFIAVFVVSICWSLMYICNIHAAFVLLLVSCSQCVYIGNFISLFF
jgi:hypothetical protein